MSRTHLVLRHCQQSRAHYFFQAFAALRTGRSQGLSHSQALTLSETRCSRLRGTGNRAAEVKTNENRRSKQTTNNTEQGTRTRVCHKALPAFSLKNTHTCAFGEGQRFLLLPPFFSKCISRTRLSGHLVMSGSKIQSTHTCRHQKYLL